MNTPPSGRTTSWWSGRGADALLIAIALAAIMYQLPRTLPGDHLLDFGSSLASGQAARQGLNPYGVYPLTFHFMSDGFQIANPNLSPPISAILYQAFGLAEPHLAFRVWYGITVALYAATIVLLVRGFRNVARLPLIICASALAGFWETLILGQIYVPLVLATVAAWLLLARRHDAWAGVLIGIVVALKPNFAVWPVLLLLSGYRKPALIALATAALLSAVPVVAFGPDVYRQWFTLLASDGWRAIFPTNAAFSGLAARLGVPPAGFAASLLLLAGSAAWALARHRSLQEVSALALLVSLLASPLAWIHYTLFLLPVICWTWNRPGMRLFLALIIVPVPIVVAQMSSGKVLQLTLGSLYNWALLLLLGIILAADRLAVALPRLLTRSEGATVSARRTHDAAA
jgi:hypothetical protein